MKNSLNLGFIILLLVVLGCNCPNMQDLANQGSSTPSSTPSTTNSSNSTTTSSSPSVSSSTITMAKYDQIKNGMKKDEVERILGSKGTELSSSGSGEYAFSMYQWKGEDYATITIMFQKDKVYSKSQYGLK